MALEGVGKMPFVINLVGAKYGGGGGSGAG
jgi:hypothetical protein